MEYAECTNRIRLAEMAPYERKANESLQKAAHPKHIILAAPMLFHLTRSLYFNARHLIDMATGEELRPAREAHEAWNRLFFKLKTKYRYSSIDWSSFPNPPSECQWFLTEAEEMQVESKKSDEAML